MRTRTYVRTLTESEESVTVHIGDDGRIRMTAENLDHILRHIGFTPTDIKEHA